MRTLRLARVAAEAEGLLLRRRLRSIAIRACLGVAALFFLTGAIAVLHAYVWMRLRPIWGAEMSALAIVGFDTVVAIVLGLFAMKSPSDRIATDAVIVRDKALVEMRSLFSVTSMMKPLAGLLFEQLLMRRRRKKA